ncbi:MAG: succinyl-diaminopimelate desuccinylase [Cycloclasticus pugetii]|jgi:succinyl-diaminopimelate desuccinylase|uniref:Succinyl-diaminopimelate desuccinylase n=1 Tax=Cycloclasticus zancles 78-ME TaxID=1198232 RepID=S5TF20_9GAMM|nr:MULTISPECIES: succinyl-diaminopimelate desuccinylase [Cycloclasticus]AGS39412.1 Succinyl-diaminopimelate desuccinylase [Cycloclasticus zancles 78-ME]MDF1829372.1 succinyl-diaminopimelate desuccinylase [Cycloclasticus pugetii]SHI40495.1 succinyldiaminopimelate desuccinylase [Cycloclasticus pugetii]
MSDTLNLTLALLKKQSLTPNDAGCMDLMAEYLQERGFKIEWMNFGETRNMWARKGSEAPLFCFAGHTDVVPTGPLEEWSTPPFEPTIKDGLVYARGAADMKGSLAAMMTACDRFITEHSTHNGSISFLITSDEEGPAHDGTVKVIDTLNQRKEKIDFCIVGEPSSHKHFGDMVRVGRRGSINGYLTLFGKQGHVAYPELVDNPIHALAPILSKITAEKWDEGNEYFPPTSFQISNINAGTGVENVVPGQLNLVFNLRFSSELTPEDIKRRITYIVDQNSDNYELSWQVSGLPFLTEKGTLTNAVEQAIYELTGSTPVLSTGGGTSDGRFIAPSGAQLIELGPINETIHKVNECVRIDDLDTLSLTYSKILENILL